MNRRGLPEALREEEDDLPFLEFDRAPSPGRPDAAPALSVIEG